MNTPSDGSWNPRNRVCPTWSELKIPEICERLIGFSVPQEGVVLVVSYEGMHLVTLAEPVTVSTDFESREFDLYDPDCGIAEYQGQRWKIVGLHGGDPILRTPGGEELRLDVVHQELSIWKDGRQVWSSAFENFSGDWAAATFSPDGRFLILGCPYDFDFRVWELR